MKDLHDTESRVTDSTTGGAKGAKLTQLGALDPAALIELGRVAGMGAEKYSPYNYLKGYDWALSFNAMMRHALLFWAGETNDPESGLNHMAHAAWMALSLVSFSGRGLGTDTRYVQAEVGVCRGWEHAALDAGTHEPAVDDFGNQYLARRGA